MRSNPMSRIIIGAAALMLLAPGAVSAQGPTPPPREYGESLRTSVITNALDDARINRAIEQTAKDFHTELGGRTATRDEQEFWLPEPPRPDIAGVTDAVLKVAQAQPSVVVISGGDGQANVGVARNFDLTTFIDLGQALPCVTEDGQPDPSGTCAGGEFGLPFNYTAVDFAVEDGAYLAGLLAAAASRNDRLGIISGAADCVECNRYIHGFVNGARSVDPEIDIQLAYLADDEATGFGDAASARTFTEAFLDVFQPDVLLPIGRGVSTAMIEAVCAAGDALAVGTGIDVAAANPDLAQCVLTSVSKDVVSAVQESMYGFAQGEAPRIITYGLTDGRVSVTPPTQSGLPVDTAERYQEAETGILTGQIDTCPGDCGAPLGSAGDGEPDPAAAGSDAADADAEAEAGADG